MKAQIKKKWPTIEKLLSHIFDDHFENEMILDYLTLITTKPYQKLPIILLYADDKATGRSTFLNFMKMLLEDDAGFLLQIGLKSDYNSYWAKSTLVMMEDITLELCDLELLKSLTTAKTLSINAPRKNVEEIYSKLHFILTTEINPHNRLKDERRFWILETEPFGEIDLEFEDNLKKEIISFKEFIKNRSVKYKVKSPLWFEQKDYQNTWFYDKENAQPISEEEFCRIHNSFYGCDIDKVKQLTYSSFKGNELREYVNHFVNQFIKKTTTDE